MVAVRRKLDRRIGSQHSADYHRNHCCVSTVINSVAVHISEHNNGVGLDNVSCRIVNNFYRVARFRFCRILVFKVCSELYSDGFINRLGYALQDIKAVDKLRCVADRERSRIFSQSNVNLDLKSGVYGCLRDCQLLALCLITVLFNGVGIASCRDKVIVLGIDRLKNIALGIHKPEGCVGIRNVELNRAGLVLRLGYKERLSVADTALTENEDTDI